MSNRDEEPKLVFVYHNERGFSRAKPQNVYNCRCGIVSGMIGATGIIAMFASALLIAIADGLIKKTSASGTLLSVVLNPWMVLILVLYFIQILLAAYVFIHKGELAVYGNIFIVFYSILMVLIGIIAFGEHLSLWQGIGIVLALAGAVLINSGL